VIVVDTHTLIWWVLEPSKLSAAAREAINSSKAIGLAVISCWEVGMLSDRRRIELDLEPAAWLHNVIEARNVSILPITIEIGVLAAELQDVLRNPADCLIAATALTHGVPLVTKDERIQRSGVVATIW
jgi:PIN domain nuclease of toxin-antitoxin system